MTKVATQEWQKAISHLKALHEVRVDRQVAIENKIRREYYGFSDASNTALGAVIYCVLYGAGETVNVTLVAAKSRITPKAKVKKTKPKQPIDPGQYQPIELLYPPPT